MGQRWNILDCLKQAQEAEASAATTSDPFLKEQWHRIALGYAELAQKRLAVIQAETGTPPGWRL